MKRLFSFCIFFLVLSSFASAALHGPITEYFSSTDTVYLARVSSIESGKVTFSVTETLRGHPVTVLTLTNLGDFKPNSEYLLASYGPERSGSRKDEVGWLLKGGYLGWLPAPVVRISNEIYVKTFSSENGQVIATDKAPDGTKGLTLDHIKRLLEQNPYKP